MQATRILRGPSRERMSSKRGNKNYYKGRGSGTLGEWTAKGRFVIQSWKMREFVVPNLDNFHVHIF